MTAFGRGGLVGSAFPSSASTRAPVCCSICLFSLFSLFLLLPPVLFSSFCCFHFARCFLHSGFRVTSEFSRFLRFVLFCICCALCFLFIYLFIFAFFTLFLRFEITTFFCLLPALLPPGRNKANSDAECGADSGPGSRGAVRQHRSRQLVHCGRQGRAQARGGGALARDRHTKGRGSLVASLLCLPTCLSACGTVLLPSEGQFVLLPPRTRKFGRCFEDLSIFSCERRNQVPWTHVFLLSSRELRWMYGEWMNDLSACFSLFSISPFSPLFPPPFILFS